MLVRKTLRPAIILCLSATLIACHPRTSTRVSPTPHQTLRQAAAARQVTIGAAAFSRHLVEPDYANVLGSEFSQLQPENEMKFAVLHPAPDRYDFSGGDALVDFAKAHKMAVRGHTLVWHRQVPLWISTQSPTPARLADILRAHINNVTQHYAGKVYAWDVVNEAFNDDGSMRSTVWYDQPGIGFAGMGAAYVEQTFRWTRAADPQARLFYNDYDAEPINPKSNAIYAMAKDFKARGVPLDGIGFQLHVDLRFANPATLASFTENLKRFAALGLEIHFTEIDIRLTDHAPASLAAQARLYGDITRICLGQPACKLLQTWGFTDKYSWVPGFYPGMDSALLWDADYNKKPAYFSVLQALETPGQ